MSQRGQTEASSDRRSDLGGGASIRAERVAGRPSSCRSLFRAGLLVIDLVAVAAATALVWSGTVFGAIYGLVLLLLVGGRPEQRLALGVAHDIPMLAVRGTLALVVALVLPLPPGSLWVLSGRVLSTLGLVILSRAAYYHCVRTARRHGLCHSDTVVVGEGEVAAELVDGMRTHPEYGLRVVGLLGQDSSRVPRALALGPIDSLDRVLRERPIDTVVVAFGRTCDAELVSVLRTLVYRDVDVYVVPRFFEIGVTTSRARLDDIWGIPVQRLATRASRQPAWRFKRVLDVLVSASVLLLLSPLLAAIAVVLKLTSPGPVLFRQRRVGQGGREFDLIKFRTLRVVSPMQTVSQEDADGTDHIQASRRHDVESRQTPLGRILRATSVDELPQLWNILRGEMSLVGPRPEEVRYARLFTDLVPGYRERHRLPVGLTGLAQVHGLRGETSIAKRVRFDNSYIERWSFWRDLTIIARTFKAVLSPPTPASAGPAPAPARPIRASAGPAPGSAGSAPAAAEPARVSGTAGAALEATSPVGYLSWLNSSRHRAAGSREVSPDYVWSSDIDGSKDDRCRARDSGPSGVLRWDES